MDKYNISKQTIYIIIILMLFIVSLGISIFLTMPEKHNYEAYQLGLEKYENKAFKDAYRAFGKVSKFSKLKQAALYRQALCASNLDDKKSEMHKYTQLIKHFPKSALSVRARYQKAQLYYNDKKYQKALKYFRYIVKKYPNTDYALASKYYIACVELELIDNVKSEKSKQKIRMQAIKYLREYLKAAPTGKFATACTQKWISSNLTLNNEDNLLIGIVYQDNGNYSGAQKYLANSSINIAWPYLARNAYEMKNFDKLRFYTEEGIKGAGDFSILINTDVDEKKHSDAIYKAIDLYLKSSLSVKSSLSYLLSISNKSAGYDYLLYKNCMNLPQEQQAACYNTLYYQYPKGRFAAEALTNIFYEKVRKQEYNAAIHLGKQHLSQFQNVKSSPKVLFWLAKSSERVHKHDSARNYYKRLIRQYPDNFYAYHAFLNLNHSRYFTVQELNQKPVVFPYKDSNNSLIYELVKVRDYGLVNILYSDDPFIKSWLLYQQGNYASSATVARDAIDEMTIKPDRKDLRWRLVYPLHYYDFVVNISQNWRNDPNLILSIIREESYFNPDAKSAAGAMGLMQLMPSTARETAARSGMSFPNPEMLFNPEFNIKLGNAYFANLVKSHDGKELLAVLSYNGGIGSVNRWKNTLNYVDVDDFVEQIPYLETQNYIKKVYRTYWNYLRIYEGIKF